jgi:tRNA dimethylallyltransferase
MVRQYAKRQATWFRHHAMAPPDRTFAIRAWISSGAQFSEMRMADLFAFIDDFLLTRRTMAG